MEPVALFVHCRDCVSRGQEDKIAVIIIDDVMIQVVCENHDKPKPVYSITLTDDERAVLRRYQEEMTEKELGA